jgi:hypothetical protein
MIEKVIKIVFILECANLSQSNIILNCWSNSFHLLV